MFLKEGGDGLDAGHLRLSDAIACRIERNLGPEHRNRTLYGLWLTTFKLTDTIFQLRTGIFGTVEGSKCLFDFRIALGDIGTEIVDNVVQTVDFLHVHHRFGKRQMTWLALALDVIGGSHGQLEVGMVDVETFVLVPMGHTEVVDHGRTQ